MEERGNQDNDILFVYRHPDGAVTLYSDEEWAIERGIKPEDLHVVEIPRRLYAEGTIQSPTYLHIQGIHALRRFPNYFVYNIQCTTFPGL